MISGDDSSLGQSGRDEPAKAGSILVVDDDPMEREILRRSLGRLGYRVLEAEDGSQALTTLRRTDVDLVVLDIMMPGMTGLQVLEQRALDAKLREIPFIVVSALDELDTTVRCIELGADDYLTKPYEPAILRARIGTSMERKHLRDREKVHLDTIHAQAERLAHTNGELMQLTADLEDRVAARTSELEQKSEELRSMTQQLWQAAKLATMGEIAASVAHELNNPLATVSLRVESVLLDLPPDDPRRRPLEVVEGEVERMARLIARLLEFSRRAEPQKIRLDLSIEVGSSLELVQNHLKIRDVIARTELGPGPFTVLADRQQMRQVLLNLFTNAVDAMPDGGTLTIRIRHVASASRSDAQGDQDDGRSASAGSGTVVVEVCDTGVGIAPDVLARVFEPFFTTKAEGQGTGLGLAICRRAMQEHDGLLEIESEPGQGAIVRLTLPSV